MKLTIKKLQGEEFNVEVEPTTTILEIKKNIAVKYKISVSLQKLLYMGRALIDDQTISSYPAIKNGTKLHLIVRKPETLLEGSTKYFKEKGMSDAEAKNTAQHLVKIVKEKFDKMSWDDIERLAWDCIMYETGQSRPSSDGEMECDDAIGL
ncbi:ubiquitin-like protein 4A [Zerene cesonia]|uniref:ubiquitin-like protein 4A n=1 Tax=Zerene cesonia TaxID=33412 RepID=UPI0018E547DD|nr:ubiquitin-like protein 4A [Zerene cesonia]